MTAQLLRSSHGSVGVVGAAVALALQSVVIAGEQTLPPGRPDKPFVSVAGNVVTILVSPPVTGGLPSHYLLQAYRGSDLAPVGQIDMGSTLRFTTTAPDGLYVVTVVAVNETGLSAPSPPNAVVVGIDRVELAPTGTGTPGTLTRWLTATRLGDSSLVEEAGNVGIGAPANTVGPRLRVQAVTGDAIVGTSQAANSRGVVGQSPWIGVLGTSSVSGVQGETDRGNGVLAISTGSGNALRAEARGGGVAGAFQATSGNALVAQSSSGAGVYGESTTGTGVRGVSQAPVGQGVYGQSPYIGVLGVSQETTGVQGVTAQGNGLLGIATGSGNAVWGEARGGGYAGFFDGKAYVGGNLHVTGDLHVGRTLSKSGGTFLIDHPLDPDHMVLRHAFVESPEMKNVYDGTAVLDSAGRAEVVLPTYFEALNTDLRYQLTPIGSFAPLFIATEVSDGRFVIAGGQSGLKVSWQVTGVRRDAWALANPIKVEERKSESLGNSQTAGTVPVSADRVSLRPR